jgi:hypothetical protein
MKTLPKLELPDVVPEWKKQLQVENSSHDTALIGTFSTEVKYDGFYVLLKREQLVALRDWLNAKLGD